MYTSADLFPSQFHTERVGNFSVSLGGRLSTPGTRSSGTHTCEEAPGFLVWEAGNCALVVQGYVHYNKLEPMSADENMCRGHQTGGLHKTASWFWPLFSCLGESPPQVLGRRTPASQCRCSERSPQPWTRGLAARRRDDQDASMRLRTPGRRRQGVARSAHGRGGSVQCLRTSGSCLCAQVPVFFALL